MINNLDRPFDTTTENKVFKNKQKRMNEDILSANLNILSQQIFERFPEELKIKFQKEKFPASSDLLGLIAIERSNKSTETKKSSDIKVQ